MLPRETCYAPCTGSVWKIWVDEGESIKLGEEIMMLESMKLEIPIHAPASGCVKLLVREGQLVGRDDELAHII